MLIKQQKTEKLTHCSWLNNFCRFNKNDEYIFNSYSEKEAMFYLYIWFIQNNVVK